MVINARNQGVDDVPATPATAAQIPIMDMVSAWGPQVDVVQVPALQDDCRIFDLETIAPDGGFLLGNIYRPGAEQQGGTLALINIKTLRTTVIHEMAPGSHLRGADVDADRIVWMEGSYVDRASDTYSWDLHAYNRHSGEIKYLAGEPAPSVCSGCGTSTLFSGLGLDSVIWYQVSYGSRPPSSSTRANITNLVTGATTHLVGPGGDPVVSWPYIGWLSQSPTRTYKVQNMKTGESKEFSAEEGETLVALDGDTLVGTNREGAIYLTDLERAQTTNILEYRDMSPTHINSRLVLLAGHQPYNNKLFAWDRLQQRLVQIVDGKGKMVYAQLKGDYLMWIVGGSKRKFATDEEPTDLQANEKQTIFILDTATLPGSTP